MLPCTRFWGSTSSSWQEILHIFCPSDKKGLEAPWSSWMTVQEGCLSGLTDAASCLPFTLPLLQRARKARNMAWCLSFPICRNVPSTFPGGNWDSTTGLAGFSTSSTTFSIPCPIEGQSTNEWRRSQLAPPPATTHKTSCSTSYGMDASMALFVDMYLTALSEVQFWFWGDITII